MSGKCQGILGWIFGHKFSSVDGMLDWQYCRRCGMPEGGWRTRQDAR